MTNKELVLRFYAEVFNKWDVSNIDQYMHDDYKQHNATVEDGKTGFLKFCETFFSFKPQMKIYHAVSEGDLVVVFFKCTMGNGMVAKVFDMYRIRDGKFAEHWDGVEHDVGNIISANGNSLF
jgi:predicted SnoaL-like aldol condensation-catalyzing enzyme